MKQRQRAALALVDGTVLPGWSFGTAGESAGEVVFHAGMTGGQEILTASSCRGQCEGMRHRTRPLFSVRYRPEASPGPRDSNPLFCRFIDLMEKS